MDLITLKLRIFFNKRHLNVKSATQSEKILVISRTGIKITMQHGKASGKFHKRCEQNSTEREILRAKNIWKDAQTY